MQSKATFDLDQSNNPGIRLEIISTPDVRDKIAKRVIESLGHTSQWCEILPVSDNEYFIWPIKPDELRMQAAHMLTAADELERKTEQYKTTVADQMNL